jgi:hypothetical protein
VNKLVSALSIKRRAGNKEEDEQAKSKPQPKALHRQYFSQTHEVSNQNHQHVKRMPPVF